MEYSMPQKSIIVTGAAAGLGRAFALDLAWRGHSIVLADLNEAGIKETDRQIRDSGGKSLAVRSNVTSESDVEALIAQTIDAYGQVDVLINCAALLASLTMKSFLDISLKEWEDVLRVNVTGTFLCTRAAAAHMKKQNWGRLINLSSDTALMGMTSYLHYTTSKAAILGMTRSLARELGPHGITANAVLPGATETEITRPQEIVDRRAKAVQLQCIPRNQVPQDLLGTIRFLISDDSAFMTGQSLVVNGGACHL
jgi:NAD(P)-dependent dehydrogenase (short-subunit alcohol dehydrogenase family)